jgi:hypothetical protein
VCGVNYREAKRPTLRVRPNKRRQRRAPRPDAARRNQVSLWDLSGAERPRLLFSTPGQLDAFTCLPAGRHRDPLRHRVLPRHQDRHSPQAGHLAGSGQGAAGVQAP